MPGQEREPLWKKRAEEERQKRGDITSWEGRQLLPRFGWQFPTLSCVACSRQFFPWSDTPLNQFDIGNTVNYPVTITLVKTQQILNGLHVYEIEGRERTVLQRADELGWRQVHLFGRDFAVCPECVDLPSTPPRSLI